MESSNLRRKDTTKGPPLRVLSLDGGGVRGYSMLILLQELMYSTYVKMEGKAPRRGQIPKPCDHFDLIAGTGTGGLIALMLGRLRLDLETCKDVYVRMTKRVFETDKTFAGIPYRSTLFKASKLEEAIRECVAEHTVLDEEGYDEDPAGSPAPTFMSSISPRRPTSSIHSPMSPRRTLSRASVASGMSAPPYRNSNFPLRRGNSNAPLYDARENRTKTAVTAVYKGTSSNGGSILLRSYDSRKEPPPEFDCTIWQAGRATSATGLAFKPIQIGQSVFHDEGAGKFNPAPQVLDEAALNEWPGRDVGVFVSIGTGKRQAGSTPQQHTRWEGVLAAGMGDFAEARKRLIAKIEDCEVIHESMVKEHLPRRGVSTDNYYRLNVEVGVGEFGMNEWNRLADISTNTRRYLAKSDTELLISNAAQKMAGIHRAKMRYENHAAGRQVADGFLDPEDLERYPPVAELPGVEVQAFDPGHGQGPNPLSPTTTSSHQPQASHRDQTSVLPYDQPLAHRPSPQQVRITAPSRELIDLSSAGRRSNESHPYPPHSHSQSPARSSEGSFVPSPRRSSENPEHSRPPSNGEITQQRQHFPPLPSKTPLPYPDTDRPQYPSLQLYHHHQQQLSSPPPPPQPPRAPNGQLIPPYPHLDGPPPTINVARKPEYHGN